MAVVTWRGGGTYAVTITGAAGANTKGTYTQVTAATTFDSSRLYVGVIGGSVANQPYLLDIATGAGGAETVVVPDLQVPTTAGGMGGYIIPVNVDIASGTRLSARVQSLSGGSDTLDIWLMQEDRALGSLATPVQYGALTASSQGTQVDPGGSANTKGAYSQLTASTTANAAALVVIVTGNGNAAPTAANFNLDIATGAAASETVVIPDLSLHSDSGGDGFLPAVFEVNLSVASGTRLAARAMSSITDATDRLLFVTVLGMQSPTTSGSGGGSFAFA